MPRSLFLAAAAFAIFAQLARERANAQPRGQGAADAIARRHPDWPHVLPHLDRTSGECWSIARRRHLHAGKAKDYVIACVLS